MFVLVYACYVFMLVVVTKCVVKESDVVLAAIVALEVRMLVCFSVRNEFHPTASVIYVFP